MPLPLPFLLSKLLSLLEYTHSSSDSNFKCYTRIFNQAQTQNAFFRHFNLVRDRLYSRLWENQTLSLQIGPKCVMITPPPSFFGPCCFVGWHILSVGSIFPHRLQSPQQVMRLWALFPFEVCSLYGLAAKSAGASIILNWRQRPLIRHY